MYRLGKTGNSGKSAGGQSVAFVSRVITYVANLVAVSVLLEGAPRTKCVAFTQWKHTLLSWVMETFRSECKRLLSPHLYQEHLLNEGDNPLEEVIASFCLEPEPGRQPTTVSHRRCDKCLCEIANGAGHGGSGLDSALECCECGKARCMQCFGMPGIDHAKGRARTLHS